MLVIDDTAVPKKGTHSVGVAAQYASALGKTANCQTLCSLTLARGEVPVMVALRLFLPDSRVNYRRRLKSGSVFRLNIRTSRTKPEIALGGILIAHSIGVRFALRAGGCRLRSSGFSVRARRPAGCWAGWHPSSPQGVPCPGRTAHLASYQSSRPAT